MASAAAADLLSVDVNAISSKVAADVIEAEKQTLASMDEKELFSEAAKIEAELQRAMAALAKKTGGDGSAGSSSGTAGPIGPYAVSPDGTPIDCGAVAAAAIAACETQTYLEAELAKAKAALEKAKSKPPRARAPQKNGVGGDAGAGAGASPPSTPSRARELVRTITSPVIDAADQALDSASVKLQVPKSTVAAAVAGMAVAAGALVTGLLSRSRR